ncbi:MAG TPA: succinate dehydrogenase flavoprotein subunit [Planctomycetota bacterium]|nr:succinate dehydrogenase flavoprotein subunit [Planctomycetota bacterium]
MARAPQIAIVGGGLAGLMAAIKAAEMGADVKLFSSVPCKRSHSVCAQGGINAAVNTKGEGDSPDIHFDDTIYGGDFLASQELPRRMCYAGPGIIHLLDRMGVRFSRTPEGLIDFRRFGGTKHHRTAFSGATTGQQLIYALDEQVRRWEAEGRVTRFENWEFLDVILDGGGACRGITAMPLTTLVPEAFRADAVILATGGIGAIFGRSTNSINCTGSALGAVFRKGVIYANPEFIQVHPTAVPGEDKDRLISESVRGEGGRVWVPKDGKPWYFLEEKYPKYGNLVPRDIATREIFRVVHELGLGVDGKPQVYLDVSHLDAANTRKRLGGVLEIYEKFVGGDPTATPMRVFPSVHYTMGGMWVDNENEMTNVPGLFSSGEANYQYHGANRLGANSLLSCIFGGMVCGPAAVKYARSLEKGADAADASLFDTAKKHEEEENRRLVAREGTENLFLLHDELGKTMNKHCTVIRINKGIEEAEKAVVDIEARLAKAPIPDRSGFGNQSLVFARQMANMLPVARAVCRGALLRNESRGAHYKPDFPNRDDANFLKTTLARWSADGPKIDYEPVECKWVKPRPRKYD